MGKRSKVITATALMTLGAFMVITAGVGGGDLQAASVDQTGLDIARYLVWAGAGSLLISAFLFISAGAD